MTFRHLKVFIAVCEFGSVTVAANNLFLAQPSVSLAIRELEDHYGVKLFDRISRKLYITEPGQQLLNYASHIVSLFDKMENEIKNWDSVGTLRVGSSITIGNYLLPNYVKQFNKKYPQIKVQVIIDNSSEIEKRVMSNEIDFGLIEGLVHNTHIKNEKFMDDELVLICAKGHSLTNKESIEIEILQEHDFILREKGSGVRQLFDSMMLIHNFDIKPIWESVSTQAIVRAVSVGLGLSVLPYLLVKQDIESGTIHSLSIKGVTLQRQLYIIYHENKFLTQSAKDFIQLCHKDQFAIQTKL